MAERSTNTTLLFTESHRGVKGFLPDWYFLVHEAFRPALDIKFGERINEKKTKELRDRTSLRLYGVTHNELKRQITEGGSKLGDSAKHQEVMRYAYREPIETIGNPPKFAFRATDGLESRCGRWYVQVQEVKETELEDMVVFHLFARNTTADRWHKHSDHEMTQIEFSCLLRSGANDELNLAAML